MNRQTYSLPPDLEAKVQATLQDWQTTGKVRRLWAMDASLWTGTDESQWLGWLGTTEDQLAHLTTLESLSRDVQALDINHILL